ncbi:MAG: hypothetical protein ABJF10_11150 [Chthoniobacter sp.]|uniref:hypothetical protein n=1 Tax=Chthoniobacter sp. TaxID=2510640 RepID=UPI0032A9FE19
MIPSTPSIGSVTAPEPGATGIALASDWTGHTTQGSGGQTMKMADLLALVSNYGKAEADLAVHPEVTIYEGQVAGGAPGENCRITYLMPLDRAEALLMKSKGLATSSRAVAPGLPDGLFLHTYDVKAGIYNRLCIVTDSRKPVQQVVSLIFKAEGANWYPPSPPFVKINRDWHTFDYVNTENRGSSSIKIDTRVKDMRRQGGYIVVNTTGGVAPDTILEPGVVLKPARNSPKEDTTWYVPVPLVKLMLYCLEQTLGSGSGASGTAPR